MNLKLVTVGVAAAMALGIGSLSANAGPLSAAPSGVQTAGSLVLKADYDGDGRYRWWRHRRFADDDGYGEDRGRWWWWRHHRYEDNHRPYWRDRDAREGRYDRWR
jgi:hypothetical protein